MKIPASSKHPRRVSREENAKKLDVLETLTGLSFSEYKKLVSQDTSPEEQHILNQWRSHINIETIYRTTM